MTVIRHGLYSRILKKQGLYVVCHTTRHTSRHTARRGLVLESRSPDRPGPARDASQPSRPRGRAGVRAGCAAVREATAPAAKLGTRHDTTRPRPPDPERADRQQTRTRNDRSHGRPPRHHGALSSSRHPHARPQHPRSVRTFTSRTSSNGLVASGLPPRGPTRPCGYAACDGFMDPRG